MATACPARPLREKFRSRWRDGLRRLSGAGAPRRPGPRVVAGQGPGGAADGEEIYGARERMCPSQSLSPSLLSPGPECESPDWGGFLIRGYPTFRAPGGRTFSPGMRVRGSPRPCLRRTTPMRAPGELRSNLTKLAAGCAGLYLGVGRGPGSPARSCGVLQAVPPPRRAAPAAGTAPPPWRGRSRDPAPSSPAPAGQPRGPRPKALAAQ